MFSLKPIKTTASTTMGTRSLHAVLEEQKIRCMKSAETEENKIYNENVKIIYSLDTIKFTKELSSSNKNNCPYAEIWIVLDCSGSTRNFDGGDGGGLSRVSQIQPNIETPLITTKPIILAEIDGVSHTLELLMSRFNMSNVKLVLLPFSTSYSIWECEIESNEKLCALINKDFINIPYEGGCTELVPPLKHLERACSNSKSKILSIIATDGQPSNKTGALAIVKNIRKKCDLIVIGAGSIGTGACTDLCFRGRNVANIDPAKLQTLVAIGAVSNATLNVIQDVANRKRAIVNSGGSIGHSECDINYLKEMVNDSEASASLYVGAYKDYSELKSDVKSFLDVICDTTTTKKFGIKLNDQMIWYDDVIQFALHGGQFAVFREPIRSDYYLVTPQWQMAIQNPFGNNQVDICVIAEVKSGFDKLTELNYTTVWKIILTELNNKITLVKDNQEELVATIMVDNVGNARVRQVLYK